MLSFRPWLKRLIVVAVQPRKLYKNRTDAVKASKFLVHKIDERNVSLETTESSTVETIQYKLIFFRQNLFYNIILTASVVDNVYFCYGSFHSLNRKDSLLLYDEHSVDKKEMLAASAVTSTTAYRLF